MDIVNHPPHYTDGNIEVIDFIEDKGLNFHLGNAVKYISRAGKKDPAKTVEDLQKAQWYVQREIERQQKKPIVTFDAHTSLSKMVEQIEALQSHTDNQVVDQASIREVYASNMVVNVPIKSNDTPISEAVKQEIHRFWQKIFHLPIQQCPFIFLQNKDVYVSVNDAFATYVSLGDPTANPLLNFSDFEVALADLTPGHLSNEMYTPSGDLGQLCFKFDRSALEAYLNQTFTKDHS